MLRKGFGILVKANSFMLVSVRRDESDGVWDQKALLSIRICVKESSLVQKYVLLQYIQLT